jgi:hypothetical protein
MTGRPLLAIAAGAIVAGTIGCGGGAASAPTPTPRLSTRPPTPAGSVTDLSGAWNGTGSDPQGPERMAWTLAQSGNAITGTADLAPLNAADGSCASCHKFKAGTVTGTMSGSTIAMRLVFPSGGDGVPTPMCTITFDATAAAVASGRIDATYSGDDTCEGPISGGTFSMTR